MDQPGMELMDLLEHIRFVYRCQIFKVSTKADENIEYIFQHVIKRFLDENKYIFNVALYSKLNNYEVYYPPLELVFPYFIHYDSITVKLIITDLTASNDFNIVNYQFSKNTKSFVSLFDVASPFEFVNLRYLIKDDTKFFGTNVSIFIGALNCKLYQKKK